MSAHANKHLVDFLVSPYEKMRSSFSTNDELAAACKESVKALVKTAIRRGVLPNGTLMMQFAHVSDGTLSLDVPPAVKRDLERELIEAAETHAAFVKTTSDLSLFREIAREFDRGVVVLFTRDGHQPLNPPTDVDLVRVEFPCPKETRRMISKNDVTASDREEEEIGGDFVFVNDFEKRVGRRPVSETSSDHLVSRPQIAYRSPDSPRLKVIAKSDYQRHISAFVQYGYVVVCAPRVFREGKSVGGGCLFVLREFPSEDCLYALYALSHKIKALIVGFQDTAQRVSDAVAKATAVQQAAASLGMMKHSLENSFDSLRSKLPAAAPYMKIEGAMIAASCAYGDMAVEAIKWSDICSPLQEVFFPVNGPFTIDDAAAHGKTFDPRFVGILIELSRNLNKHTSSDATASLKIVGGSGNLLGIHVEGRIASSQACTLWKRLKTTVDDTHVTSLRGIPTILLLAESLAARSGEGTMAWRFFTADKLNDHVQEQPPMKKGLLLVNISGPSPIFDPLAPDSGELQFTLDVSGIFATTSPS